MHLQDLAEARIPPRKRKPKRMTPPKRTQAAVVTLNEITKGDGGGVLQGDRRPGQDLPHHDARTDIESHADDPTRDGHRGRGPVGGIRIEIDTDDRCHGRGHHHHHDAAIDIEMIEAGGSGALHRIMIGMKRIRGGKSVLGSLMCSWTIFESPSITRRKPSRLVGDRKIHTGSKLLGSPSIRFPKKIRDC